MLSINVVSLLMFFIVCFEDKENNSIFAQIIIRDIVRSQQIYK